MHFKELFQCQNNLRIPERVRGCRHVLLFYVSLDIVLSEWSTCAQQVDTPVDTRRVESGTALGCEIN